MHHAPLNHVGRRFPPGVVRRIRAWARQPSGGRAVADGARDAGLCRHRARNVCSASAVASCLRPRVHHDVWCSRRVNQEAVGATTWAVAPQRSTSGDVEGVPW